MARHENQVRRERSNKSLVDGAKGSKCTVQKLYGSQHSVVHSTILGKVEARSVNVKKTLHYTHTHTHTRTAYYYNTGVSFFFCSTKCIPCCCCCCHPICCLRRNVSLDTLLKTLQPGSQQ